MKEVRTAIANLRGFPANAFVAIHKDSTTGAVGLGVYAFPKDHALFHSVGSGMELIGFIETGDTTDRVIVK